MGFREAKRDLLAALRNGRFLHEARREIDTKNLLLTGRITPAELAAIVSTCRGIHHTSSPHHQVPDIEVHVLRRSGWYIKFYFADPNTVFISVHR